MTTCERSSLRARAKAAFSAGPDFGRLIPLFTRARQPEDEWDRKLLANRGLSDIAQLRGYDCTKPAIAAINGFCIAGGMEFIQSTCRSRRTGDGHWFSTSLP